VRGASVYACGPMAISLILAHPSKGSFNHAIADVAAKTLRASGHEVHFHDLCAERFDPMLPGEEIPNDSPLPPVIEQHCREIVAAEGIVVVHPNWWGQPPAVLKGWLDRVMRQGVAYKFGTNDTGEGVAIGLLKAKRAVVFNTANTPADRERELFGDPLENLWKTCVFDFCGVKSFVRRLYAVVVISTAEQRREWLKDAENTIRECFPG